VNEDLSMLLSFSQQCEINFAHPHTHKGLVVDDDDEATEMRRWSGGGNVNQRK
jgi:hypothetical protein